MVEHLVDRCGLLDVAARACEAAGVPGREQAVAYCLAALVLKDDPVRGGRRFYELDLGAEDFPGRLARWAATVAANLARWGALHDAIHEEADRYEITSLRALVRSHRADDHIDEVASRLMSVLAGGPRVDEMTLERLREAPPARNAYAFQSPLPRWVTTAGRRLVPEYDMDSIDDHAERLHPTTDAGRGELDEVIAARAAAAEEELDALLSRVARLGETRALLAGAIARADGWEAELARRRPERPDDAVLLNRLRAALLHVADRLRRERAAVTGMLSFLVLAMRPAAVQQQVAILSLRVRAIDPEVVSELRARMQRLVGDARYPARQLVDRTRVVVQRGELPRSRLTALQELRDSARPRDELLAPLADRLAQLPDAVQDTTEIADLVVDGDRNRLKAHRSKAAEDLSAVDLLYGAVFRRYAMGRVAA